MHEGRHVIDLSFWDECHVILTDSLKYFVEQILKP